MDAYVKKEIEKAIEKHESFTPGMQLQIKGQNEAKTNWLDITVAQAQAIIVLLEETS